jgi:anti-anti-sigma factor
MEVTNQTKGEAIVFYFNGDLTTTSSPEAQAEINEVLESAECKLVVINVENVNFIASTGLRVMLALGKKAESIRDRTCCLFGESDEQIGFQDVWVYRNIQYL